MIRAVVFDLDGVVRHFDKAFVAAIEEGHGMEPGELFRVAFSQPLLAEVTTGRMRRAEWVERVGQVLGHPAAATEWGSQPWVFDEQVLDLVDELRSLGLTTAILTNGTDTIREELAGSRAEAAVDAIFNSAEIGYVKPDPRVFEHVLHTLDLDAGSVFFTDDTPSHFAGADALGMRTHLYTDVASLRAALRAVGVDV